MAAFHATDTGVGFSPLLVPRRRALLAIASLIIAIMCGALAAVVHVSGLDTQPRLDTQPHLDTQPRNVEGTIEVVFAGAVVAGALAEAIWVAVTSPFWRMAAGSAASIIAFGPFWGWKEASV